MQQAFDKCAQSERTPVLVESLLAHVKSSNVLRQAALHLRRNFYPEASKLQKYYESFTQRYEEKVREEKEEQARKENEVDEDGFVLVGKSNFKKRTFRPQDESDELMRQKMGSLLGVEDMSLLGNVADDRKARKKAKKKLENFYGFQKRETRMQELLQQEKLAERNEEAVEKMKRRKVDLS